jgi:isopentenyldiphosphate isomerase
VDKEALLVVNSKNSPIGKAPRGEVHQKGLLHRASHIFIFDCQDRLILQKRSYIKDFNPGKWTSSASGHVRYDSDYLKTAIEELSEELGLQISEKELSKFGKPILVESKSKDSRLICKGFGQLFIYRLDGSIADLNIRSPEVLQIEAFSVKAIYRAIHKECILFDKEGKEMEFADNFEKIFKYFMKGK